MPTLYMTVGLPRSGKSTWAKAQHKNGAVVVNPDSIRLVLHGKDFDPKWEDLVWHHVRIMIESLFQAGHQSVILDATGITRANRAKYKSSNWNVEYVFFGTHVNICCARAVADKREYLVEVIHKMENQFEYVHQSEGVVHDGEKFNVPR